MKARKYNVFITEEFENRIPDLVCEWEVVTNLAPETVAEVVSAALEVVRVVVHKMSDEENGDE